MPSQSPQDKAFGLSPGQTIIFLGDHTSPDDAGYVRVVREVLARFFPDLHLNLITAGAKGQTAAGLRSQAMIDILTSSKPDWVAINLGLGDTLREPDTRAKYDEYVKRLASEAGPADAAIGPEHRVDASKLGPVDDNGKEPEPQLERLASFRAGLAEAVELLKQAGVRPILFTPVLIGSDLTNPLNNTLRVYARAIREIAQAQEVAMVDVERAFRDVLDRATTYKQRVSLTTPEGAVNPQGEALIARNFLQAFGLLPGFRHRT